MAVALLARRWLFNVSFPSFPQVRASVSQTQLLKCPLGIQSQHVQNWTHHFLLPNLLRVLCQIIHLVTQQGNLDSGAPATPSCPEHTTHITSSELLTPINSVPPNTSSGWFLLFPPTATELMPLGQRQMHWPLKVRDLRSPIYILLKAKYVQLSAPYSTCLKCLSFCYCPHESYSSCETLCPPQEPSLTSLSRPS